MTTILHIALPTPFRHCFEYLSPPDHRSPLIAGMRVRVPFRRREIIGILLNTSQHASINAQRLRPAIEIIDQEPLLPEALLKLCTKTSQYYHHPIGEVLCNSLPTAIRQGKSVPLTTIVANVQSHSADVITPSLNRAQQQAVSIISSELHHFKPFLLFGVTGSGKTEVYLHTIQQCLKRGKQALLLVPEIGLTPQTLARFAQRFNIPIAVLHSSMTDKDRLQAWLMAKQGQAGIVIGTRSAVFTPLPNLGMIVVDEEHDVSYKQQDSLRYSARDIALLRGKLENIPVVLGSATPSLESFHHALRGNYQLISLPERAGNAKYPSFQLLDVRNQPLNQSLSTNLSTAMQRHLRAGNQVLIFLNRRGFAPTLMCHLCGWIASCRRCDARMTLHQNPLQLLCHHCGKQAALPSQCPACLGKQLITLGLGTQRLEQELRKQFPDYSLTRIDRDSTRRKGKMQDLLEDIHKQRSQILIGTQMLAKGHHFPNVTMVVILNIDDGLFSADFRASERTAQLLTQVAGRAGRAEQAGEVWIPTHLPHNPLLNKLIQGDYASYVQLALSERKAAQLPPYSHLALFRAEAMQAETALSFLNQVKKLFEVREQNQIVVLGPIPAPMEKKAGRYRAHLLLQSQHRTVLHNLLENVVTNLETAKWAKKVRWSLDIDPQDML